MGGQIFINYRRDDSSASAGRLYDRLSSHFASNQIFIDVDNLAPGVDFVEAIEESVGSCDVLIAVIGRRWLISSDEEGKRRLDNPDDFVRIEIATALKRNIRVIPILVEGGSMPVSRDLPNDLKPLVRRNALEVSHTRFNGDCERLIGAIERVLESARAEHQRKCEEKERRDAEQRERDEKERLEADRRQREEKDRLDAGRRERAIPGTVKFYPSLLQEDRGPGQAEAPPIAPIQSLGLPKAFMVKAAALVLLVSIVLGIWFVASIYHGKREATLVTPTPTAQPSATPTAQPSPTPTAQPSLTSTAQPSLTPTAKKKYVFGFSQVTVVEPWRVQFNKDMKKEADKHPELELIITDAQDKTEKQVADVENLIQQGVDVLLISPKESAGLTEVTLKAIEAKIPVIILDRSVNTDKYTQFIGGNNVTIGRAAGEYAVKLLGGPGNAKGNIVELWGGMGTQPAYDRHDGFAEFTSKEPGIKSLLQPIDTDWKQSKGYEVMSTALKSFDKIDLVYGHNDPVAYGAFLAAKDAGREKEIKILGIDALPNEGVTWVCKGELTATFLYATAGAEGVRQGLKIVKGEQVEKKITLPTMAIDKTNCEQILKDNGLR
jgi:ribose transport system substrate-binding protein